MAINGHMSREARYTEKTAMMRRREAQNPCTGDERLIELLGDSDTVCRVLAKVNAVKRRIVIVEPVAQEDDDAGE